MGVTQNPQGWTDVTPAADTKIAYVDATDGNDGTAVFYDWDDAAIGADPYNPVGPINAYQTVAAAIQQLRDGMADWVLLKRGETWTDEFIDIRVNGRSSSEPTYVGAYGSIAIDRPLLKTGSLDGIDTRFARPGSFFIAQSIHFYAHTRNPDDPINDGIPPDQIDTAGGVGAHIRTHSLEISTRFFALIEDCRFRYFSQGAIFSPLDSSNLPMQDLRFRRCSVEDVYHTSAHANGMFVNIVTDLVVEECLFDHSGWYGKAESDRLNSPIPGASADGRSQNIYWQSTCPLNGPNSADNRQKMVCRDNFTINAAGAGFQMRAGGTATGNVSYMDPYPFLMGPPASLYDADWPTGLFGVMNDNYSEACNDISSANPGGQALRVRNTIVSTVNGNLVIKPVNTFSSPSRFAISTNLNPHPTTIDAVYNNTFNNASKGAPWDGGAGGVSISQIESNDWWDASSVPYVTTGSNRDGENVTYTDDTRDLFGYATIVLGLADLDTFWDARRAMHRGNWDVLYQTPAVIAWLKAGFDMSDAAPPIAPGNLQVTVA